MRHSNIRTTAPENLSPRWPDGYVAILRETGAQEKNIPYCIGWVRRFFAEHPGRRRRDLGRSEIESFLRNLATGPNMTNWRVQQARDALELYYERFRGISLAPRPNTTILHDHLCSEKHSDCATESTKSPDCHAEALQSKQADKTYNKPNADGKHNCSRQIPKRQFPDDGLNRTRNMPVANQSFGAGHSAKQEVRHANQMGKFYAENTPCKNTAQAGIDRSLSVNIPSTKLDWKALEAKVIEILRVGHYSYRTEQTYV